MATSVRSVHAADEARRGVVEDLANHFIVDVGWRLRNHQSCNFCIGRIDAGGRTVVAMEFYHGWHPSS
jgi:hypothetical protein